MKERPILFSTPMVQALLDGRKTQTRRIVKPQPHFDGLHWYYGKNYNNWSNHGPNEPLFESSSPYGNQGDMLWVRETWQITDFLHPSDENYGYIYKASENGQMWESNADGWKWKSSIFMPKDAARIWLLVTDVRVERLQDITEEDAIAEGLEYILHPEPKHPIYRNYMKKEIDMWYDDPRKSYQSLWESINGLESWDVNPWLWVIKFKVLSTIGKPF